MIIDLNLKDRGVVIVGGGQVGAWKAKNFLEAGARVKVVSRTFNKALRELKSNGKVQLIKASLGRPEEVDRFVDEGDFLLVAATNDRELNRRMVERGRSRGLLVYALDDPSISDFTQPSITRYGDIQIAISTGGKSPAMAKVIRQKFERIIGKEERLQVRLQDHARRILKAKVKDSKARKKILYSFLRDPEIKNLLSLGKYGQAVKVVEARIEGLKDEAGT